MFDPQMMGFGPLPDVPSVKDLWKEEKSKYRHWIVLFAIGILCLTVLSVLAMILNIIDTGKYLDDMKVNWLKDNPGKEFPEADAKQSFVAYIIVPSAIKAIALTSGTLLFIITTIKAYRIKNLAKISSWSTMIIGLAAFLAAFNLISLMWESSELKYLTNKEFLGGLLTFIFNILAVLVFFTISVPVTKIRRLFYVSEKIEQLKSDPQFQAMQQQMEAMMKNGQFQPGAFGPTVGGAAMNAQPNANGNPEQIVTPVAPSISPERVKLESMDLDKLKKVAQKLSISGFEEMKKEEIIDAILRVSEGNNK